MHEWVSVGEASRRLNVSPSTIRRMIEAGTLVGEREVIGGSKERYRVRMPQDTHQPLADDVSPPEPPDAPDERHDAPAISERLLETVLTQGETIAALRERVGRAEASAETLRGHITDLAQMLAERTAEVEELRAKAERPWWRIW